MSDYGFLFYGGIVNLVSETALEQSIGTVQIICHSRGVIIAEDHASVYNACMMPISYVYNAIDAMYFISKNSLYTDYVIS